MIDLDLPVVQAPMAGGPSTPALAAAVSDAGGLGFLAAGYQTPGAVLAEIAATRELTQRPFGVNVFAPTGTPADRAVIERYAARLLPQAAALGVVLGEPRFDDDHYQQSSSCSRKRSQRSPPSPSAAPPRRWCSTCAGWAFLCG